MTDTERKRPNKKWGTIISQTDYLLHNAPIELRLSGLAIKFLIGKALDDANISRELLDRYARPYICEPHEVGLARDCYILIYAVRNFSYVNRKIYDGLIKNANALFKTIITHIDSPDYVQTDIKIAHKATTECTKNQVKEALRRVTDNLIQQGLLKKDEEQQASGGKVGDGKNGGQSIDSQNKQEDIVELKPNFCGIGLNINALIRKIRGLKIKNLLKAFLYRLLPHK